jgi:hypothetical protein
VLVCPSSVYETTRWLTILPRGWKIRAKERFNGPFVGNTSFPIMLIGNTADPVTPLWKYVSLSREETSPP